MSLPLQGVGVKIQAAYLSKAFKSIYEIKRHDIPEY
jgi:hypothetical protein